MRIICKIAREPIDMAGFDAVQSSSVTVLVISCDALGWPLRSSGPGRFCWGDAGKSAEIEPQERFRRS
jgi:hypothetical protein